MNWGDFFTLLIQFVIGASVLGIVLFIWAAAVVAIRGDRKKQ